MTADDAESAAAADTDKRVATLTAALALRGHALYRLADGSFLAVWRGWSRQLADLQAVERFAAALGVVA